MQSKFEDAMATDNVGDAHVAYVDRAMSVEAYRARKVALITGITGQVGFID